MAWRGIHLSRPAHLSVERRALKIAFRDEDGGTFRIALEDLAYLIIDSTEATLSSPLLAQLSESGVLAVGVNERHLPVWTALPWTEFHRHGAVIPLQLESPIPLRKQLWARIVTLKISHQADCLDLTGRNGAGRLRALLSLVRSGDHANVEAQAARTYWGCLFAEREFCRHTDDLPNALLNYGYAIVRAALARSLCGAGFIPQVGLHHRSQTNAYNLADDLLEPYRPFVDRLAIATLGSASSDGELTMEHRRNMATILETAVSFSGEVYGLLAAIDSTVTSLKKALSNRDARHLNFPSPLRNPS